MKIVFFGTPHFSADILHYLLEKKIEVAAVVTKPDKPKGRSLELQPSPVKELVQKIAPDIPIYQPEKASSPDFAELLKSHHADLYIVVAYGQILKQNILDLPQLDCINVHPSLLPKYRGAAPIQRCLMEGDKESGVTIMQMILAMDAGDMLRQVKMAIPDDMNYGQLEKALCELGKTALYETIQDYSTGQIHPIPQDNSHVTYAHKIELEDTKIQWQLPAHQLHCLIRGVTPFPGAWTEIVIKGQKKRLKISLAREVKESNLMGNPGEILAYGKGGLWIACGSGVLELLEVQPEGKKSMPAQEFMKGYSKDQLSFS